VPVPAERPPVRADRPVRRLAAGMLVAAAVIFVAARLAGDDAPTWVGFVRAGAEAALVGGLADWFAVTALFRRPLGLPIPHTAIVPTRKDRLGASLGSFVEEHFLDPDLLADRVLAAAPAARLADWAADPAHRARAVGHLAGGLDATLELLRDERFGRAVGDAVLERLGVVDLAPLAGRALAATVREGRHTEMVTALLGGLADTLVTQRAAFRTVFDRESPWWVPGRVDDRVFERIFGGILHALEDLRADPRHPVRQHLDAELAGLAERLRTDPVLAARVAGWRDEALAHPSVATWAGSLWDDLVTTLRRQAADGSSPLRRQLEALVAAAADRLAGDPGLRDDLDRRLAVAAAALARRERHVVGEFIAQTVQRWDAAETAERVELAVGRDLQFIRINGTVVGALAGLAIHGVGLLL
jgi:uncharacterized membrane-anchored protein YjiN (DUF445 family)